MLLISFLCFINLFLFLSDGAHDLTCMVSSALIQIHLIQALSKVCAPLSVTLVYFPLVLLVVSALPDIRQNCQLVA